MEISSTGHMQCERPSVKFRRIRRRRICKRQARGSLKPALVSAIRPMDAVKERVVNPQNPGAEERTLDRNEEEAVEEAAEKIDSALKSAGIDSTSVHFSVDPETRQTVVKLIDTETNTVIRQIPSDKTLSVAKQLDEAVDVRGLLLDSSA